MQALDKVKEYGVAEDNFYEELLTTLGEIISINDSNNIISLIPQDNENLNSFSNPNELKKKIDTIHAVTKKILENYINFLEFLKSEKNFSKLKDESKVLYKVLFENINESDVDYVKKQLFEIAVDNDEAKNLTVKLNEYITSVLTKLTKDKKDLAAFYGTSIDTIFILDLPYWRKRIEFLNRVLEKGGQFDLMLDYLFHIMRQFSTSYDGTLIETNFIGLLKRFNEMGGFDPFKNKVQKIIIEGMDIVSYFEDFERLVNKFNLEQEQKILNDPKIDIKIFEEKKIKFETLINQYRIQELVVFIKTAVIPVLNKLKTDFKNDVSFGNGIIGSINDIHEYFKDKGTIKALILNDLKKVFEGERNAISILPDQDKKEIFNKINDFIPKLDNFGKLITFNITELSNSLASIRDHMDKNKDAAVIADIKDNIISASEEYNLKNIGFDLKTAEQEFETTYDLFDDFEKKFIEQKSQILLLKKDKSKVNTSDLQDEIKNILKIIDGFDTTNRFMFKDVDISTNVNLKTKLVLLKCDCVATHIINRIKYDYYIINKELDLINLMTKEDKKSLEIIEGKNAFQQFKDELDKLMTLAKGLSRYSKMMTDWGNNYFRELFGVEDNKYFDYNKVNKGEVKPKTLANQAYNLVNWISDYYTNLQEVIIILKNISVKKDEEVIKILNKISQKTTKENV